MNLNFSFIQYILSASPIVKMVLFLLLCASLYSWIIIFQKGFYLRWIWKKLMQFENKFSSEQDLQKLYRQYDIKTDLEGVEQLFTESYRKTLKLKNALNKEEKIRRGMMMSRLDISDDLDSHLSLLATIGSTSPYVGLFGTVWGIMMSFQALGQVSQATIAMVAPGISEALIATAVGLFAAIPAVIAYNRFTHKVERIQNRLDAFEEMFITRCDHESSL